MDEDTITDFWDNACDIFGRDVCSPSHPMNKAFLIYLEMKKEMESDEEDEDEESDEEVRTCCEKCEGEGNVRVSKERAKELKEQELMEGLCPFGDKCAAEESDEESEEDDFKTKKVYTEFDMCIVKVDGWKKDMNFDYTLEDTHDYIRKELSHLTNKQMGVVYEEAERGYGWDFEKDDLP